MSELEVVRAQLAVAVGEIESLFDAIKHGDQKHQDWLEDKINSHFQSVSKIKLKPHVVVEVGCDLIVGEIGWAASNMDDDGLLRKGTLIVWDTEVPNE